MLVLLEHLICYDVLMLIFVQVFIRTLAVGVVALLAFFGLQSEQFLIKIESPPDIEISITPLSTSTIMTVQKNPAKEIEKKPGAPKVMPVSNSIPKAEQELPPIIQKTISPIASVSEVNVEVRKALVNILCTTSAGGSLKPITGSGVIIDKRGVILTNAHIAQYFLLKDFPFKNNVDCVIRTGSPATPQYRASLLFISPAWIEANHKNIISQNPMGTGEHDFALLLIDSTTNTSVPLPTSFPYVAANIEEMTEEGASLDTYVVAGYPAGFLGGIAVIKDLFISSTVASAKQVFTFKDTSIDLLSLGGSVLAQKGSSGGAVVRQSDKKLVAIIVTTTDQKTTGERDLRAVTTTHINRSLEASTNKNLLEYLSGDLELKITQFQTKFEQLKAILVNDLTAQN